MKWRVIRHFLWRSLMVILFVLGMYTFHFGTDAPARIFGLALTITALNELFEPRKAT